MEKITKEELRGARIDLECGMHNTPAGFNLRLLNEHAALTKLVEELAPVVRCAVQHLVDEGPCDDAQLDSDSPQCGKLDCTYCQLNHYSSELLPETLAVVMASTGGK